MMPKSDTYRKSLATSIGKISSRAQFLKGVSYVFQTLGEAKCSVVGNLKRESLSIGIKEPFGFYLFYSISQSVGQLHVPG